MARADLLINLVRAWSKEDKTFFRKTVEAIIAEERTKQHKIVAQRLEEVLQNGNNRKPNLFLSTNGGFVNSFLFEIIPKRRLDDLVLPSDVNSICNDLSEEHRRVELLRSYNLEPRNKILLQGPPGNGKSTLAEAIAEMLYAPMYIVRYDGVIGSYLGETASRLNKLFEFVKTRQCVLFFDEFDTIGKERGDIHETGEIKRVVSSLLLQIDDLPSHVIVIAATNHSELLDKAVWRRFQVRLNLPKPNKNQIKEWFIRFEKKIDKELGYKPSYFQDNLNGLSFAELEEFCLDIQRKHILQLPDANIKKIIDEKVSQWKTRIKTKI